MTTSRFTALVVGSLTAMALPAHAAPEPPVPPAPAPPSFEVVDRGDAVEVIAHHIRATRTAIVPVRSRLEVAIAGAPSAKRVTPADATVKLIEIDGGDGTRTVSVKLGFERPEVKTLSRFAQAIQVGDDLHLLIPRKVPAEGATVRLPEPRLPPELAAAVAAIEPARVAKPEAKIDAKPDTKIVATADAITVASAPITSAVQPVAPAPALDRATDAAPRSAPVAAASDARATAKSTAEGKPLRQALASDADDSWSKIAMYAAIGLAAAGAGIWLMRRRRGQLVPPASIEIIAQRSLGGRARIVWLSAGPREMIVSVTAQQVRMLGQWRKADATAALPVARGQPGPRLTGRHPTVEEPARGSGEIPMAAEKPLSPAVTGILRLRGRTGQMAAVLPDDLASGDTVADELWAKEILAATGARR